MSLLFLFLKKIYTMTALLQKPASLVAMACFLFSFGCSKTASELSSASNDKSTSANLTSLAGDDEFTTSLTDSGTTILHYRPGPNNGCDVYSDLYAGSHSGNQNYVPELPVNVWEYGGLIVTRSFLKFPKLFKLDSTLHIVSAKLYLHPPKDFLNHPQGNTGANECKIQRIISKNWSEDGLTWDNQPKGVTDEDIAYIPATTKQWTYAPVIDITPAIQKMVARQVYNYGFRITLTNEQPLAAVNFASSEAVDAWRRPMLEIEYK